jgi:hypothetical protein
MAGRVGLNSEGQEDDRGGSKEPSSGPSAVALDAKLHRGFELHDAGSVDEAFAVWDEVLATDLEAVGQDARLVVADTMHFKAYALPERGQTGHAEALAGRAAKLAALIDLPRAQVIEASASSLRARLILDRGETSLGVWLIEQVAAKFADSDFAEARLSAARGLHRAVWIYLKHRDRARAVSAATQVTRILCQRLEASDLIQAAEVLLSCAETLTTQSAWRRPSAELDALAQSMIDTVLQMANETGGEARAAVALSAQIAAGDLRGREHRFRAAYKTSLERPLVVGENELSALQEVQAAAQQAGARFRSIRLIVVRADSLAQLGRRSEALAVLDELLAQLDATPGTTARGDAFFVRQARKEIAA